MDISSDVMPKMGSRIDGKHGIYELGDELGHGGNGDVFDVHIVDRKDDFLREGQEVVIKILKISHIKNVEEREKRRERFQREVKAVRKVLNSNLDVLPIIDSYMDADDYSCEWYVMPKAKEYKYNRSGAELEKLKQMRRVGVTLSKLHKIGVFHRDIKPANILYFKNRCFITDFGLVWNVEEDRHITGENEALGPIGIRPPEMESHVEKLNIEIDYQKVDVYLFVKTIWIILTGNHNGFRGEYNRSERMIYLDKDRLNLGKSIEPLHKMMEAATRYDNIERITIDECLAYIDQQIAIAENAMSDTILSSLIYDESASEVKHHISSDVTLFKMPEKITVALSKMVNIVEVVGEEYGETISLGLLNRIERVGADLFKISLKNYAPLDGRKIRRICVRITELSISSDNITEILIGTIINNDVVNPVVSNLGDYIMSKDMDVTLSGNYRFMLKKCDLL